MRQHVASFANFVCRFGDEKVLLDYAKEIVLPAFLDDTLIRTYGRTHFFFYEAELIRLDENGGDPVLGIAGRFIKNTHLTREQIFDPQRGIIHDEASLPSAPSTFFVLILNNHRLIYFPETAHAPDLNAFRATTTRFLQDKHKAFIDKTYETLSEQGEKVTKKQLLEDNPAPSLEIIPISGDEEIEAFLRRYGKLKKIEFRLVNPNDEIDGGKLFNNIREYLGPLNPDSTKLETRSSEGLDTSEAVPRIKAATATANQEVRLTGLDRDGNDLKGDNHSFQIGAPVDTIPATRGGLIRKLFGIFQNLTRSGAIKVGSERDPAGQKIQNLLDQG